MHMGVCNGVVGWVGVERHLPHGSLLVLLHVARQLRQTFGSRYGTEEALFIIKGCECVL